MKENDFQLEFFIFFFLLLDEYVYVSTRIVYSSRISEIWRQRKRHFETDKKSVELTLHTFFWKSFENTLLKNEKVEQARGRHQIPEAVYSTWNHSEE